MSIEYVGFIDCNQTKNLTEAVYNYLKSKTALMSP